MSIDYYPAGAVPIYFGVCFSRKEFRKEMKRLKVSDPPEFSKSGYAGRAIHLERDGHQDTVILCVDESKFSGKEMPQIVALIAHEAEHCTQYALKSMNDGDPSDEARAYMNGFFVQCAMTSLEARKKRKRRKK